MKVAIIGAGISGLSCAIELRRLGVTPTIYEKTKLLGDKPGYLIASLRLFSRTLRSTTGYIKSKYDIEITPLHPIKEMVMITPNTTVSAKGNHGYVFLKNMDSDSLEHQLAAYLDIPVMFCTEVKIPDLEDYFDHIVVATGTNLIAKDLNVWNSTFTGKARIATVSGNFNTNTMKIWLNKNVANNGYGYLLSRNENEAELVLAVSDITMDKLDYYWNEFLLTQNLKYQIVKYNDIEHAIGYPSANKVGNIYFTGNTGGMIDDFLGFGFRRAIESGILAARSIAYGQDYDSLLEPLKKEVNKLNEYRKMLNVLTDKDYDRDMFILGLPVMKQLIYNNPLYKAKYGLVVPKIVTGLKKKNYPFKLELRKKT